MGVAVGVGGGAPVLLVTVGVTVPVGVPVGVGSTVGQLRVYFHPGLSCTGD